MFLYSSSKTITNLTDSLQTASDLYKEIELVEEHMANSSNNLLPTLFKINSL